MPTNAPDNAPENPPENDGFNSYLPGLEPNVPKAGAMQEATVRTVRALQRKGLLMPENEAKAVLAIQAAADLDRTQGVGRPSGRALLIKAMNDVLAELPQVEVVTGDEAGIQGLIDAITAQPTGPGEFS